MFTSHFSACGLQANRIHVKRNELNVSFTASEKSLDRNDNSLEMSLSATKFRSNYHGVRRNFARTIADCCEISLELSQIAAKYRCRSNNRSPEISSKNRSKRKFANFAELRLHYFCTILYNLSHFPSDLQENSFPTRLQNGGERG